MDYRKFSDTYYIRMDRGDEIIGGILDICGRERIASATFSGIGGCGEAQIQTFLPDTGTFETQTLRGMLELVTLTAMASTTSTSTRQGLIQTLPTRTETGLRMATRYHASRLPRRCRGWKSQFFPI